VKHAPFMPPPLPEPPDNINRAMKLVQTTSVYGAHYVFVEIPLSNHLYSVQDCSLVLTVCSVSHLVDMFLTSFIEIEMSEEAFSFLISHFADAHAYTTPQCASCYYAFCLYFSTDENVAYYCGRHYHSYVLLAHILQLESMTYDSSRVLVLDNGCLGVKGTYIK
jgi:hypothetical protein